MKCQRAFYEASATCEDAREEYAERVAQISSELEAANPWIPRDPAALAPTPND